jgi:hypothetical protein
MTLKHLLIAAVAAALAGLSWLVFAQHSHATAAHDETSKSTQHARVADHRVPVVFPGELREHTLANMRDHLLALQEIQAALATGKYDQASHIAEQRLGMTSLTAHGAHEVAQYMPKGMQDAGSAMHRSASRFSTVALDSAVTNDVRPALAALAEVTAKCVACHAAYRLQ